MGDQQTQGPDGDEGAFDANAFEHAQEAEKLASAKDDLTSVVTSHEIEGVGETPITKLDILSSQWRQLAVQVIKEVDPEAYAKYRAFKYPEGAEGKPDLKTRKGAYSFAVAHFLDISYTEIEPDAPSKVQVAGEHWRQMAVQLLKAIDPDAYKEYRKRKYGKGKSPDLKTRKLAYRFAVGRFLDASYKIAGF